MLRVEAEWTLPEEGGAPGERRTETYEVPDGSDIVLYLEETCLPPGATLCRVRMARIEMRRYTYVATAVQREEDGRTGYLIKFPDLSEARTFCWEESEIVPTAADCLREALRSRIRDREMFPDATAADGYLITVEI